MNKRRMIILLVMAFVFFMLFSNAIQSYISGKRYGTDKIALIRVSGMILSGTGTRGGLFREKTTGSETIMDALRTVQDNPDIKACIIRLNSPGGSVAGSQEIYEEINRCRRRGKVVVASMGDIAASGAYYIASACDKIIANPGTLTGSIGALWTLEDMQELVKKVGVKFEVVKSGKFKDVGSPFRDMTAEDRKLIQEMILDVYDQFVTDVSAGRKLEKDYVKSIADGRLFTGRKAQKLRLVDKLGNLEYAVEQTAMLAGIKGRPRVVELGEKTTFWDTLFDAAVQKIKHFALN